VENDGEAETMDDMLEDIEAGEYGMSLDDCAVNLSY
jgi:hypothetical protein